MALHEIYLELMKAGFSKEEALFIVANMAKSEDTQIKK